MLRSNSKEPFSASAEEMSNDVNWELRPGGMLVQKRNEVDNAAEPTIKVKVSHGSYQHEISIRAQATFGDLKRVLAQETGLEPQEQRLLFRGKEKENDEHLHIAGVKNMAKVILLEDPASKERKLEEMMRNKSIAKACQAITQLRAEVDKLADQVSVVEATVNGGTKVAQKDLMLLTEMLMIQLLKLDSIEGEGEAKVQRTSEVRRVQNYVEMVDSLKARNANPLCSNTCAVSTLWDRFACVVGTLDTHVRPPSTTVTTDWEVFD